MRYEDLVRLAQDREPWKIMTANLLKEDSHRACKELQDENRKGKIRDVSEKIREVMGKSKPTIGGLKSKSGNDLSEEGPVKQGWRHYTEILYKRDDNMTTKYETKEYEEEATILEEEVRKAKHCRMDNHPDLMEYP